MTSSISAESRDQTRRGARIRLLRYTLVTVFTAVFGYVYELFSHGVSSPYMVWLFVIPFTVGCLPDLVVRLAPALGAGGDWAQIFRAFAVATLTVGAAVEGVVEIYGTTSEYGVWYLAAGLALLAVAVVLDIAGRGGRALSSRNTPSARL